MSNHTADTVARRAVRQILDAIDHALAAARQLEQARAELDRASQRRPTLRIIADAAAGTPSDDATTAAVGEVRHD
jgi:hypothetical protein